MVQEFEVSMRTKLSTCALILLLCPWAHGGNKVSITFMEDDYANALSEAKQKNLPLFVEVSAPW